MKTLWRYSRLAFLLTSLLFIPACADEEAGCENAFNNLDKAGLFSRLPLQDTSDVDFQAICRDLPFNSYPLEEMLESYSLSSCMLCFEEFSAFTRAVIGIRSLEPPLCLDWTGEYEQDRIEQFKSSRSEVISSSESLRQCMDRSGFPVANAGQPLSVRSQNSLGFGTKRRSFYSANRRLLSLEGR